MIARSLERQGWNKSRAAVELGISRQGLIKKIRRLRLVRPGPAGKTVAAAGTAPPELPWVGEDGGDAGSEEVQAAAGD
jgi:hypothetical protein